MTIEADIASSARSFTGAARRRAYWILSSPVTLYVDEWPVATTSHALQRVANALGPLHSPSPERTTKASEPCTLARLVFFCVGATHTSSTNLRSRWRYFAGLRLYLWSRRRSGRRLTCLPSTALRHNLATMAFFVSALSSSIGKRLLLFGLRHIDILDKDPADFIDVDVGKKTTLRVTDVGLNVKVGTTPIYVDQALMLYAVEISSPPSYQTTTGSPTLEGPSIALQRHFCTR